jgi:cell division protein DivIC
MSAKKVTKVLMNKYFIVGIFFMAWVMYFDQNDWMSLKLRQEELNGVKDNISYLKEEIAKMNAEKNALIADNNGTLNNPQAIEQYAREHFRMKHEGEDVYVIEK